MSKMRIAKDSPTILVLEKSLTARDIWRGWSRPLFMPLLFLVGSSILLYFGSFGPWWLWIIFVVAFMVVFFILSTILTDKRKITVTIDLHSKIASRFEKLINGKETKNELALDLVSRILIHSQEGQHFPRITLWIDSENHPRLEILNNYDLKSLVQGSYMDTQPEDISEIKSLDFLGMKIGALLGKPVVNKKSDYQGKTISEETKWS